MIRLLVVGLLAFPHLAHSQNPPHVDDLLKSLDANKDGVLTKNEVRGSGQYSRQFPRWDADNDGTVSREDIVKFRARFGIAADGTRTRGPAGAAPSRPFTIPDVASLKRVGRGTRMDRGIAANSQYILKTESHPVSGKSYVVLTDHTETEFIDVLQRLVKHHRGVLVRVEDLATLSEAPDQMSALRQQLRGARYVAIAPRVASFREQMVLGMWQLLSTLDDDAQLDCFPGFLVSTNAKSFARLIDQSINHEPIAPQELKPFAINQVQNSRETRSLQKSGILRNHFRKANLNTPIVAIYGQRADAAPRLPGDQVWNLTVKPREFVRSLSPAITTALADSNLVIMHGHGVPGMSCSLDVDGIPQDFSGKILLSGSCFSASPTRSDLPPMGQAPGGYSVESRDAFIVRAVDNGALVAFGHQRLSSGFPHLYPVLESWTEGKSVGQGYQELINGLIDLTGAKPGGFVLTDSQRSQKNPPQQRFLYIVIGDPALKPFQPLPVGPAS